MATLPRRDRQSPDQRPAITGIHLKPSRP